MSKGQERLEVLFELRLDGFEKSLKSLKRLVVRCVRAGLLTEDEAMKYAERWASAYVDKHAVVCLG